MLQGCVGWKDAGPLAWADLLTPCCGAPGLYKATRARPVGHGHAEVRVLAQGSHHAAGSGRGPVVARETWGKKCQSREPRPYRHRPQLFPEAAREPGWRPPRCIGVQGEALRVQEEEPTRTGTCTCGALPAAGFTGPGPDRGTWALGTTPLQEAAATSLHHSSQVFPPPTGRSTCAGRRPGRSGAAAPATEAGRWLERHSARALRGAAPSAGLGSGPAAK